MNVNQCMWTWWLSEPRSKLQMKIRDVACLIDSRLWWFCAKACRGEKVHMPSFSTTMYMYKLCSTCIYMYMLCANVGVCVCTYYVCTNDTCWWAWSVHHVELYFVCSQGKCQRKDPPCKYLHPPQHLREQLLQNGRNNLIIQQFQAQAITNQLMMPGVYPNMVNI